MHSSTRKSLLPITLSLVVLWVAGCSSKGTDFYKHQPSLQSLEVPPDLTLLDVNSGFEIPQIAEAETRKVSLANGADVKLNKDGRLRWLTIKAEPQDLWGETKDFWVAYKVDLNWESLKLGVMETRWISSYESDFAQDRFRIRLEPGVNKGETDLFISHRGRQEELIDGELFEGWVKNFNDPELEIEVMGELLSYFGLSTDRKEAIIDDAKEKPDLAELNLEANIPYLRLNEPYNRSWKFIAQAVNRMDDIVTQRDKKAGWMDVRLSEDGATSDFTPGFALSSQEREILRLGLKGDGTATTVTVLTDEGQPDRSELAQKYLRNLQDNL